MEQLWGDILPAPAENVTTVRDGEIIEVNGLRFTAVDTPGHASHHHVFLL
jgi:glyoxylase-like metal-dependent hydrolase (beta-lactamase superfamily II)